jgi:hypothetical protein
MGFVRLARGRSAASPSRAAGLLLALIWVSTLVSSAADGLKVEFNSSKCSTNPHGMIYVAAGRHVFHQPVANLKYVHEVSIETAAGLPIAPRPFEPGGCPDHPLRGIAFNFDLFSDPNDPSAEIATGNFHLVDIDPSSWWDTHERYALSNSRVCASGSSQADATPGIAICSSPTDRSAERGKRAAFVAVVDPQHHAGPLGQRLALHCSPASGGEFEDHTCEISYRLDQDVGVWYQFQTSLLPLSRLIAFDRELRRRISEAEVPDYWWPALSVARPVAARER